MNYLSELIFSYPNMINIKNKKIRAYFFERLIVNSFMEVAVES